MQYFFLFIGWKPTTWPGCLQIMVCSCALSSNCVWLQIIFCSCVNETTRDTFSRQKRHISSLLEDILKNKLGDRMIKQLVNSVTTKYRDLPVYRTLIKKTNLKKTKFMVFKPRQKRSICNIQISIDNQNIVEVKETNLLGVTLDENLNWKSEISHVASKVAKSIGIISRCGFFLPKSSLRMLYYSLIYPYFYYCNIVWAST